LCAIAAVADIGPFTGSSARSLISLQQALVSQAGGDGLILQLEGPFTPDTPNTVISQAAPGRTTHTVMDVVVTRDPGIVNEVVEIHVNGQRIDSTEVERAANSTSVRRRIDLTDFQNRTLRIHARSRQVAGQAPSVHSSSSTEIEVDSRGPQLDRVDLVDIDNQGAALAPPELHVRFTDDDLANYDRKTAYQIRRLDTRFGIPAPVEVDITPRRYGRLVVLTFADGFEFSNGDYELKIAHSHTTSITDRVGNPVGQQRSGSDAPKPIPQARRFSLFATSPADSDDHIEFPEFVQRTRTGVDDVFNPGHSVETRVARLYYQRDAHKVVKWINRNVEQFNKIGVDRAHRTASQMRQRAEAATDDRRRRELDALEAAERVRETERDLQQARTAVEQMMARRGRITQLNDEVTRLNERIQTLNSQIENDQDDVDNRSGTINGNDAQIGPLRERIARQTATRDDLQGQLNRIEAESATLTTHITQGQARVEQLETELREDRNRMRVAQREVQVAETREKRAAEDGFRADVAAAKEDPDTYVAGNVRSIDPVTQVSISVIGEGLIHLRGPMRGIDKIRTMINQIDSPVGQVKVGIFTVQINGEHGDRMERVAGDIEGNIDLSRFLTNYSLNLIRRSIQEVSSNIIAQVDAHMIGPQMPDGFHGHHQSDRDRRYVYAFFGRDFADELYEMDSEFLRTENKLLSLHSMDTVSQSQATFILALAKNDVRQAILNRFRELVQIELPEAEWDFRLAADLATKRKPALKILPKKLNSGESVMHSASLRYKFRNFLSFFEAEVGPSDAMTPLQREFIRLAQIFKSTMLAEMELKQRIVERALIQQRTGEHEEADAHIAAARNRAVKSQLERAVQLRQEYAAEVATLIDKQLFDNVNAKLEMIAELRDFINKQGLTTFIRLAGESDFFCRVDDAKVMRIPIAGSGITYDLIIDKASLLKEDGDKTTFDDIDKQSRADAGLTSEERSAPNDTKTTNRVCSNLDHVIITINPNTDETRADWERKFTMVRSHVQKMSVLFADIKFQDVDHQRRVTEERKYVNYLRKFSELAEHEREINDALLLGNVTKSIKILSEYLLISEVLADAANQLANDTLELTAAVLDPHSKSRAVRQQVQALRQAVLSRVSGGLAIQASGAFAKIGESVAKLHRLELETISQQHLERESRVALDHRKLLDYLIDEKREKLIELREGTRSHIAQVDNYLKRLAIALEDDFKVQFYDPAFRGIREASYSYDVNLGQVERTTILTNNRALAIVRPQATMEFDLPKRAPVIVEAMNGARAMMQDYGNLLQDPTFIAATGMLSGSPIAGNPQSRLGTPAVRNVVPGMESDSMNEIVAESGGPDRQLGGAIQALVPEPAIYKFETGTGFQIRPVIQPDGHSVIYNFNYMYTTNVREPVDADEKHLGRIKRHFIDTEVQTSSFELREISRYQVALKASRTSRGVPLLEDVPGLGVLFRPLPSDESSLQQNIILGHTTVYPTLFDLMGLRWSRHVADLDHMGLRDAEHVIRGRNRTISDYVFERTSEVVDDFLDIEHREPHLYRPDLYHRQDLPSPYHPSGFIQPDVNDPTGRDFYQRDRRPVEHRDPRYDSRRRGPADDYRGGVEKVDVPLESIDVPVESLDVRPEGIDVRPQTIEVPLETRDVTREGLMVPASRQSVRTSAADAQGSQIQRLNYEHPAQPRNESLFQRLKRRVFQKTTKTEE
jgi:hypothetical protein